jgi:hypothetical protein
MAWAGTLRDIPADPNRTDAMATKTVWCVFERLPEERCPALTAVCASIEVAEELVELGRREKEADGEPPGEWTVTPWTVLDRQVARIDRADQISHVLDPMRGALAYPAANEEQ